MVYDEFHQIKKKKKVIYDIQTVPAHRLRWKLSLPSLWANPDINIKTREE